MASAPSVGSAGSERNKLRIWSGDSRGGRNIAICREGIIKTNNCVAGINGYIKFASGSSAPSSPAATGYVSSGRDHASGKKQYQDTQTQTDSSPHRFVP